MCRNYRERRHVRGRDTESLRERVAVNSEYNDDVKGDRAYSFAIRFRYKSE